MVGSRLSALAQFKIITEVKTIHIEYDLTAPHQIRDRNSLLCSKEFHLRILHLSSYAMSHPVSHAACFIRLARPLCFFLIAVHCVFVRMWAGTLTKILAKQRRYRSRQVCQLTSDLK